MTAWEPEESGNTLTALPWGTQESGAGEVQVVARTRGRETGKAPSPAPNKEGARGRHGASPGQGGKKEVSGKIRAA